MEVLDITPYRRRWLRPYLRPDMWRKSRLHVVAVLESGLMFREDSLQVEQRLGATPLRRLPALLPMPPTRTEKIAAAIGVVACISVVPVTLPLGSRGNAVKLVCYCGMACLPLALRLLTPSALPPLLQLVSHYTRLARRHVTSKGWLGAEGVQAMLVPQQRFMCRVVLAANSALLDTFPWLDGPRGTASWEHSSEVVDVINGEDLTKIHHLFLVLQSTFLKNVALAHFPSTYSSSLNKDANERVYWLHTMLLPTLTQPYQDCSLSLENAYRYYKENAVNRDLKLSLPRIVNNNRDPWQYSEVHAGICTLGTDLRTALIKCNEMDSFLEACWTAKSKFSPAILEEDLTKIRESLIKCFGTIESASIKLKKIKTAEMKLLEAAVQRLPLPSVQEEDIDPASNVRVVSEETPIQVEDQVFYYEKTDDSENAAADSRVKDFHTGPGRKEIDMTKVVLGELKNVLIKREDEMRAREAIALENTMPELKGKVPDFPRQIRLDNKEENEENNYDFRIERMYDAGVQHEKVNDDKPTNGVVKNDNKIVDGLNGNGKECLESLNGQLDKNNVTCDINTKEINLGNDNSNTNDEPKTSERILKRSVKNDSKNALIDTNGIRANVTPRENDKIISVERDIANSSDDKKSDVSNSINEDKIALMAINTANGKQNDVNSTVNYTTDERKKVDESGFSQDVNSDLNGIDNLSEFCRTDKDKSGSVEREKVHDSHKEINEQLDNKCSGSDICLQEEFVHDNSKKDAARIDQKEHEEESKIGEELLHDEYYYNDSFSDSGDSGKEDNRWLLRDVRKNRISRKKNHPPSRSGSLKEKKSPDNSNGESSRSDPEHSKNSDEIMDEGLRPVEYNFGTGLAMASLLQISQNGQGKVGFPALGAEETFAGSGEVSEDSGNEG